MKKVIFFLLLGLYVLSNAQCTIQGQDEIQIGEAAQFQIPTEYAQCEDCHQWKTIGGVTLNGDNRKNQIEIKAINPGNATLGLTMLTPKGIEQCSKNITIKPVEEEIPKEHAKQKVDCDIKISDFKEVKYSQNTIAFFPNNKENEYLYSWQVNYIFGGEPKVSNEKVPVFENNPKNTIKEVTLSITSKKCLKKFSKQYTPDYWLYFDK